MGAVRALLGIAVVVLVLAGADVVAKRIAEGRIETRARAEVPDAGSVEARIASFPFLPRLLVAGSAGNVGLRFEQVPTRTVRLSAVDLELRGVKVDRDALFSAEASVDSIERGTLSAEIDAASLNRALPVPVSIGGGEVRSRVGPLPVSARPAVGRDGALLLRFGGSALTVSLPRSEVLACAATRVAVVGDRLRLSCEVDEVPAPVRSRAR